MAWIHPPGSSLVSRFVENYWFLARPQSSDRCQAPKLIPNTSANLVLTPPLQQHLYFSGTKHYSQQGSHLVSSLTQALEMKHDSELVFLGIKLRPGVHWLISQCESQELLNSIREVPGPLTSLNDLVGETLNEAQTCHQLDIALEAYFCQLAIPKAFGVLERTLSILTTDSGLLADLPYSRRTIERSFAKTTGMRIKQFSACRKLEDLLIGILALSPDDLSWPTLAQEFGYSDQSHMIREVKKALGKTPEQQMRAKDVVIDVYGDEFSD
ncbi:helix-turn-helix domain-containing protein [Paraferrimonas sedimenticola]|nr:helix-turn-helix domain-containing protein [Paraferrimonas sedimenticola]